MVQSLLSPQLPPGGRSYRGGARLRAILPQRQVLMQLWIILRNSGLSDALSARLLSKGSFVFALLTAHDDVSSGELKVADPLADPLYRLQYLARRSVLYDLADLTAIVLTPLAVAFFVWRDGWFSLQGTGSKPSRLELWLELTCSIGADLS